MRILRALLSATLLLVLGSATQAASCTFCQIQWSIKSGVTPSDVCVMNGSTCIGKIGTFNLGTGVFIPNIPNATVTGAMLATGAAVTNLGFTPISTAIEGIANGIATLDSSGFVPLVQLPPAIAGGLAFQGNWNANTNSPALVSSVGVVGKYYFVSVSGTTTLDGVNSWTVGDLVLFSSGVWNKIPGVGAGAPVTSVAGLTGAITGPALVTAAGLATSGANTNITSLGGLTGNVTMTGTGERFIADMSNATLTNRFAFQTSDAVNTSTTVNIIPHSGGNTTAVDLFANSTVANTSFGFLAQIGTETRLAADKVGSGTYGPLTFYAGGAELGRFDPTIGSFNIAALNMGSASQALTMTPYGSSVAATTSLSLKGPSIQSNIRNFLSSHSMQCATDHGRTPGNNTGCVTDFADIKISPNALEGWARNASTEIDSGFVAGGGLHAHGDEINMTNNDVDIGNTPGDPGNFGPTVPQSVALGITAVGPANITGGIGLGSNSSRRFNRGFYAQQGTIQQCTFCDYSSGATTVMDIQGPHQLGIDLSGLLSGNGIRLSKTGTILARNAANSSDMQIFAMDGADHLNFGFQTAGIVAFQSIGMGADGLYNFGSSAARVGTSYTVNAVADNFLVGTASPVAGVSCPAGSVSLSTLVVTKGIVTHC